MEPHSHNPHPDLSNQIEIPSSIFNSNLILGTSGSNPWVDGIFYAAQWGKSIEVALNQQIPVYSFYFLKSEDSNLFAGSERLRSQYQQWEGVKGKRGLAPFPTALQEEFLDAYKTISDVSKLELREANDPKDASVWIANAYYTNKGKVAPGIIALGSHQGLVDHNTGKNQVFRWFRI